MGKVFFGVGLFAALIFFLALVITKDPKISSVGKPQKIECYSGGRLVFSDELSSVLDSYNRNNPGCTATAVANEVFGKWRWSGWILARNNIEMLCAEGLVDERFFRGISTFYPVEKKEAA